MELTKTLIRRQKTNRKTDNSGDHEGPLDYWKKNAQCNISFISGLKAT